MTEPRDESPKSLEDPTEVLLQQLSYYRATVLAKLDGLSPDQLSSSIVPSGWSPLGLLKHLVFVERRWMQWGFEADQCPTHGVITIPTRRVGSLHLTTMSPTWRRNGSR
jgi:hypothetical protein